MIKVTFVDYSGPLCFLEVVFYWSCHSFIITTMTITAEDLVGEEQKVTQCKVSNDPGINLCINTLFSQDMFIIS